MVKNVSSSQNQYPKLLKQVKGHPQMLFFKGKLDGSLFENSLTIVGSRRMSAYAKQVVDLIVPELVLNGVNIITGFTYGCEIEASKSAIELGASTVAIMPCGIETVWPAYHKNLYNKLLENNGLIISEFSGKTNAQSWMFSKRNIMLATISNALLVVEASEKSNTLEIADMALKHKRKVFAVPGQITSNSFKGCLKLIKNGAQVVSCAGDILSFFKVSSKENFAENKKTNDFSDIEKQIFSSLENQTMSLDEIAKQIKIPINECSALVSMMQLKGIINENNGKYFLEKSYVN